MTLLLVMPMVLVLACQSIGLLTGLYRLDRLMNAPGAPWVDLLTGATFGILLALVILLLARLRIEAGRSNGVWRLIVTLHLTTVETVAFAAAAGLLALFAAHLVADGVACARGAQSAC